MEGGNGDGGHGDGGAGEGDDEVGKMSLSSTSSTLTCVGNTIDNTTSRTVLRLPKALI